MTNYIPASTEKHGSRRAESGWLQKRQARSVFDLDIVLVQQPRNPRRGKPSLLDPVRFGVDGIIVGRPQIGLLEQGSFKHGQGQVAIIEYGAGQIGFHEVDRPELATAEDRLLDFAFVERAVVKLAPLKSEREPEFAARVEPEAQHLAVLERDILEGRPVDPGEAQVAADKRALDEFEFRQVAAGQIRVGENAVLVFSFGQGVNSIEGFVLEADWLHTGCNFGLRCDVLSHTLLFPQ